MLRPRRAKQKPVQSHEIVGILPSEEAAIQKALMASIAKPNKATPTEGSSPKSQPHPLPKKVPRLQPVVPVQRDTRKYSRSTTPGSISLSPLSLMSGISFMSSDSLSSNAAWSPSQNTPSTKVKGRKKVKKASLRWSPEILVRRDSVSRLKDNTLKTKPIERKRKVSLSSSDNKKVSGNLKSIHKAKETLKAKKAKLIACAVRKKASARVDEPRNKAGLTVDEILLSVAKSSELKERSKSKSPKVKTHKNIPQTSKQKKYLKNSKSKSTQMSPSPSKGTPRPTSVIISPKESQVLSNPESLEVLPQALDVPQASQEGSVPIPAESAVPVERDSPGRLSPNSFPYQAQRKFASNHSPPAQSSNQELATPSSFKETPKTEDFLHFLCLRGSKEIPECYKKFELPWTPVKQPSDKEPNARKPNREKTTSTAAVGHGLTAKKLDFTSEIPVS